MNNIPSRIKGMSMIVEYKLVIDNRILVCKTTLLRIEQWIFFPFFFLFL